MSTARPTRKKAPARPTKHVLNEAQLSLLYQCVGGKETLFPPEKALALKLASMGYLKLVPPKNTYGCGFVLTIPGLMAYAEQTKRKQLGLVSALGALEKALEGSRELHEGNFEDPSSNYRLNELRRAAQEVLLSWHRQSKR